MMPDTEKILTVQDDCAREHCEDHPVLLSITRRNHETTTRVSVKVDRMSEGLYGSPESPETGFIHQTLSFFNEVRADRALTQKRMSEYDAVVGLVKKRINLVSGAIVTSAGLIVLAFLTALIGPYLSKFFGV
jgi:hypothetical protein